MLSFFRTGGDKLIDNLDSDFRKIAWLFLATVIMQILLYLPTLTLPFAGFEDFQFLEKGWSGFMKNPNIPIQIDVGRPLGAVILGLYAGLISSVADLNIVRSISAIVLSICQMSLIIFLLRSGLNALVSFGIATTIFTTATISSTGQWAAAAQMPVAILFAFLAAEFLYRGVVTQSVTEGISLWQHVRKKWILLSFITLSAAFLTYPTLALFFVIPFFSMTLFCKKNLHEKLLNRMLLASTVIISLVYTLYFFGIKLIYFPLIRNIYPEKFGNPIYTFDINSNILSKIIWMFTEALPRFTEVLAVSNGGSSWVVTILLLGLCAFIYRILFKEKTLSNRCEAKTNRARLFFLICFFGIANAHLILAESATLAPRIYAVGQTMVIIAFFASLIELTSLAVERQRRRVLASIIIVLAVISFFFAKQSIHTTALNQWVELRYLGAEIKRQYTPEVNTIAVVQVPRRSMFIGTDIPGYNWTNSDEIGSMIPAMAAQALINIGINDRYVDGLGSNAPYEKSGRRNLKIIPIKPEEVAYIEVNSAEGVAKGSIKIIDMRQLLTMNHSDLNKSQPTRNKSVEVVQIYSSAGQRNGYIYGPQSAIRADLNNPDRFWEAGPMPISLRFIFESGKNIQSYSLGTGIGASGRMPIAWKVEGFGKDNVWEILDQQQNQTWTDGESKIFPIRDIKDYTRYQIVFEKTSDGILRIYDIKLNFEQ